MSRGGSFACCSEHSDAGLVILRDRACKADCGGGVGALQGVGIVGALCPPLGVARAESPRSEDVTGSVPSSRLI